MSAGSCLGCPRPPPAPSAWKLHRAGRAVESSMFAAADGQGSCDLEHGSGDDLSGKQTGRTVDPLA